MEKRGDFRLGESKSDFDMQKLATHTDSDGFYVADEKHKTELKKAKKLKPENKKDN
jgi:hypothetical protein